MRAAVSARLLAERCPIMLNQIERLQQVVTELFGNLTEPSQIAEQCLIKEIKGFRGNPTSCPMVKLVREQVDFPVAFSLGKKLGTGQWWVLGPDKSVSTPAPMVCDQFSDQFDKGKHPGLCA